MIIVKALRVLACLFVLGAALLVLAKGQNLLVVALIGTSQAALLWAAATMLTFLNRIARIVEWTALKESRVDDRPVTPDGLPRASS